MLKTAFNAGDRTLCFLADGVGIVVAEIRLTLFPVIGKLTNNVKSSLPRSSQLKKMTAAVDRRRPNRSVIVRIPINTLNPQKKYTYEWAVTRIYELEQIGISDPVSYFNNEMADWWLAPGGMMEDEADFPGIARAIEERWHN